MKRLIFLILVFLCCANTVFANAGYGEEPFFYQANYLHDIGLFNGTGTDQYGFPVYELDRAPTREEAVTMLVRMLGAEDIAINGNWNMPFSDVSAWAVPYVGYAYENGLTAGTSATTFGGTQTVTSAQFITMMLRALGYQSGVDFEWDKSWMLTDELGITNHSVIDTYSGELNTIDSVADYKNGGTGPNGLFTRGDCAALMYAILNQRVTLKNSDMTINRSIMNTRTKDLPTEYSIYEGYPSFTVKNTSIDTVIDCMTTGLERKYECFYIFLPSRGLMEDISYSWYDAVSAYISDKNQDIYIGIT